MTPIGIELSLFGVDGVRMGFKSVREELADLGPASQRSAQAATANLGSMQASAAQTAAALRQVPAQFTDIVVSLQSGQQPLTVLLQQGGQLKDMFGGVLPAVRALGGYMLGLVTPINLLIGSVGALAVAFYQGSQEWDEFNRSIIMSGNLAGVTAGKLAEISEALSGRGYSQHGAADTLAQLAETGKVGATNLERFAAVAMDLEKRAGIPVKNTVESLKELAKSPVEASIKLNEQYGYLTAATLAQIKALEDEGRALDAGVKAQQTYADAMSDRARELTQNLGYVERAWEGIKSAAIAGWNAMMGGWHDVLNLGREQSPAAKLQDLQDKLALKLETGPTNEMVRANWQKGIDNLRAQINRLQAGTKAQDEKAGQQSARQAIQNAGIAALSNVEKANDLGKSKAEQAADALKKYRGEIAKVRAAQEIETDPDKRAALDDVLDPKRIAAAEAAIRKKFEDKGAGRGAGALQRADRRLDLSEIQNAMRQEQALLGQQQQQLELYRSAGLISLQDYYAQKRDMVEKGAQLESDALKAQIGRLETEKTKGADALNVQKQITDLRGKLAVRQIQTQNELAAVDQQAAQAANQHAAAIAQLGTAYAAYVDQLQRAADLQVAAVGMGDRQRGYVQGLSSIREKYLAQMRQLEDQRGTAAVWTPENEEYFNTRTAYLRTQQQKEVEIYRDTFASLTSAQADWTNGARRAWENFTDASGNAAQTTERAFTAALDGVSDRLTDAVMTGKLKLGDLARSVSSMFVNQWVRQGVAGVGGWLGSTFGFAKGAAIASNSLSSYRNQIHDSPQVFAFAKGAAPKVGVFGEAGPEAIVPLMRMPDGNLGVRSSNGNGEMHITYAPQIHIDGRADIAQAYTMVRRAVREGQAELLEAMERGTSL